MNAGRSNTTKRPPPDETRVVTLEINVVVPVWHDTGCDGEPIATVCRPEDEDHPWHIQPEGVSARLIADLEEEFSVALQEAAAKEAAERAEDRRGFRGMSEEEYMERLHERRYGNDTE